LQSVKLPDVFWPHRALLSGSSALKGLWPLHPRQLIEAVKNTDIAVPRCNAGRVLVEFGIKPKIEGAFEGFFRLLACLFTEFKIIVNRFLESRSQ
jgi:hypothetical protein